MISKLILYSITLFYIIHTLLFLTSLPTSGSLIGGDLRFLRLYEGTGEGDRRAFFGEVIRRILSKLSLNLSLLY